MSGYDHREKIEAFTGGNANSSCPVCGASLDWDWMNAGNLILHIDWHGPKPTELYSHKGDNDNG